MLQSQDVPWVKLDADFQLNMAKNVTFPWGKGRGQRDNPDLPEPGKHNAPYFLCSVMIDGQDRKWSCPDFLHAGLLSMGLSENMVFQIKRSSEGESWSWQVLASDGQWYTFEKPAGPPQGAGHAPPTQNLPNAPSPPQGAPAPSQAPSPAPAPPANAPQPAASQAAKGPPPSSYDILNDIVLFDECLNAARVVWKGHFPKGGFSYGDLYKTAFTFYKSSYGKASIAEDKKVAMSARLS